MKRRHFLVNDHCSRNAVINAARRAPRISKRANDMRFSLREYISRFRLHRAIARRRSADYDAVNNARFGRDVS